MISPVQVMSRQAVVLIGCGAQAKYCWEIFSILNRPVIRVLDPIGKKVGSKFYGLPVEAYSKESLLALGSGEDNFEVAVCASDTALKDEIMGSIENQVSLASAIHPASIIAGTADIGPGAIINPGAVIQPNVRLGKGVMIHANTVVEHDCRVGDYVNLAMGVILAGGVKVNKRATVFTRAVVTPNITIGSDAVVGAGSLVLHDIPDNTLAYGSPAMAIKRLGDRK